MAGDVNDIVFDGFPVGLDTSTADGKLGPTGLRTLVGLSPQNDGSLRHAGDFRIIVPYGYNVVGFHRWSYGGSDRLLFVTSNSAGANLIYVWDETASGGAGAMDRAINCPVYPHTTTNICRFLQAGLHGEVFVLLGVKLADGSVASRLFYIKDVLTTTDATDVTLSITGTDGYTGSVGGAAILPGVLDSTGLAGYQWAAVFTDSDGRKSVFFPSDRVATPLAFENAELSFGGDDSLPLGDLHTAIDSGDIVSVDIYRVGGKAAEYRFVKTYEVDLVDDPGLSGGKRIVDHATGERIIDDVSDELLSFIVAPTYNDPAPASLEDICLHQNKMFGINQTGVWFTRTNDFLYWGYDENGVDDDGGVIYPDNNTSDPFNGLASEGSLLVLGRAKSIYTLYGSSLSGGGSQGFAFDQRSNLGNVGRLTITRGDNAAYYLGHDQMLRVLSDAESPSVSERVRRTLRSITPEEMNSAVVCHHNDQIYLSLPDAGICLVYDVKRGTWREAGFQPLLSRYMLSQPRPLTGELELLSAPIGAGGIFACETYNDGTIGTARPIHLVTDKLRFAPQMSGRIISINIEGEITSDDVGDITCVLHADSASKTYTLVQAGSKLLYYVSLPPILSGKEIYFEITGTLSGGSIGRIVMGVLETHRTN